MRTIIALSIVFLLFFASTISMASVWEVPPNLYCGTGHACLISTPTPDPDTRNELTRFVNDNRGSDGEGGPRPGDTITICNGNGCTTYTYTQNGGYNNGHWEPTVNHGSGGSGGTGGTGPVSGCQVNCNGEVHVGEIETP